jgi:hypothetical protein
VVDSNTFFVYDSRNGKVYKVARSSPTANWIATPFTAATVFASGLTAVSSSLLYVTSGTTVSQVTPSGVSTLTTVPQGITLRGIIAADATHFVAGSVSGVMVVGTQTGSTWGTTLYGSTTQRLVLPGSLTDARFNAPMNLASTLPLSETFFWDYYENSIGRFKWQ